MKMTKEKFRTGFTVAELLISLVIMAMLMAAVAVAVNASVTNFKVNKDMYDTINRARQAILRITTDVRSSVVKHDDPANKCSVVTSDGRDITYEYSSDEKKLYLVVNSGSNAGRYLLCENVSDMSFTRTTLTSNPIDVKDVQISMTVETGTDTKTLAAAAVVRKNL